MISADRARAAFLGLGLGDAYGRPLEFIGMPRVRTTAVLIQAGAFAWTDDTHMAMYLAQAVLDLPPGRFDPDSFGHAVGRRFVQWSKDPLTPSTAPGNTCLTGAYRYAESGDWRRSGVAQSDGCGAVMRIAPLAFAYSGATLAEAAAISALVTHGHPNAVESAVAGALLLRAVLETGRIDEGLVRRIIAGLRGDLQRGPHWKTPAEDDVVARALEAAIEFSRRPKKEWLDEGAIPAGDGGWRSPSALGLAVAAALSWGGDFATAVDKAARIAGDSDSVACLAGMYLGAAGGLDVLPAAWTAVLPQRQQLLHLTDQLLKHGDGAPSVPVRIEPERRTSENHPIEVAWLPIQLSGRIGLTFAPGKKGESFSGPPWDRSLSADLDRLVAVHRIGLIACLLEDAELQLLQIPDLIPMAEARGMAVLRLPIPDGGTPSRYEARRLAEVLLAFARAGQHVLIHCRGGLGRAGTIAALCLIDLGVAPMAAMEMVRKVRPGAIENAAQECFIEEYR